MKRVLITGGSRGIGRAMVELFSKEGYRVAFTYNKSSQEAESIARATGAVAIFADLLCERDIIGAVEAAVRELSGIDILINNAGIADFSLVQDVSLDRWNKMLSVNLTAPFLFCREALPYMIRQQWGRIINVSSMWGLVGSAMEVHYSAAKAGLIGMTKAMAKELGPSGITVNAIAPGVIETDMNASLSEDDKSQLCDETPLGRIGIPSEVAKSALYLAGDGASFITGHTLNVSGGFVI